MQRRTKEHIHFRVDLAMCHMVCYHSKQWLELYTVKHSRSRPWSWFKATTPSLGGCFCVASLLRKDIHQSFRDVCLSLYQHHLGPSLCHCSTQPVCSVSNRKLARANISQPRRNGLNNVFLRLIVGSNNNPLVSWHRSMSWVTNITGNTAPLHCSLDKEQLHGLKLILQHYSEMHL